MKWDKFELDMRVSDTDVFGSDGYQFGTVEMELNEKDGMFFDDLGTFDLDRVHVDAMPGFNVGDEYTVTFTRKK